VKWHIAFKHFSLVLSGKKYKHRNQEKNNELVEFQSQFHSVFLITIHYLLTYLQFSVIKWAKQRKQLPYSNKLFSYYGNEKTTLEGSHSTNTFNS
jgi:hypothetical protein